MAVSDKRDLRDAESIGELLADLRSQYTPRRGKAKPLSEIYDKNHGQLLSVSNYAGKSEDHSLRYRKELEHRAADGDKYAAALLRGDTLAEEPTD